MTVEGDVTAEDRKWAVDFITKHFNYDYVMVLGGNLPDDAPNWHSLFHQEWTSNISSIDYNKALWLRRGKALLLELTAAYARFLGRTPPEDEQEELKIMIKKKD